ncbi:MAG: tetratricopeptide repeat protein [Casimicrobiaceae bacterium]
MKAATRSRIAALAVAGAMTLTAFAAPLEEGLEAYRAKDYAKAAALWRPLAEAGDATAQYRLATLYAEGQGVEQDDELAFKWFLRAAEKGEPTAQYDVGASYMGGHGVGASDAEGAKWFLRAANQGMAYAQFNVGLLYASGAGVPKDSVEALKWLELALFALPAGGPRSDVSRAIVDITAKMTTDEIADAKSRGRRFRPKAE